MQTFLLIFAIIVLAAITLGGYAGFLFFLTNVMPQPSAFGLGLVALIAGIAGFFNPCAFPLLPAYLGRFYLEKPGAAPRRAAQLPWASLAPPERGVVFRSGLSAALGVTTFNILLGILLAILGAGLGASFGITSATPNPYVRWLRGLVGLVLLYLGASHLAGRGNPFASLGHLMPHGMVRERSEWKKFYGYGFGYTLLGIGCGGPILGSLAIFAVSTGGFRPVFASFTIYTLTMATLMVLTSLLIGFSRQALLARLRASVGTIQRIAGFLILVVGVYLIVSSIFVREFARVLFP